jgi:serine/threonine-protein kinase
LRSEVVPLELTWTLPENGDVVGGKYRIERLLGMGGMGAVFEATHLITQRRFALKWLLQQPAGRDASVKRFVREAKVAGRCSHRHIVEVYDIHQEARSLFMVMELLRGESFAERLLNTGRMPAPEAIRLLLPCLSAIEAAHAAGIVHRDIKPANLFICAAHAGELERAKVLDFGVACFSSAQGTPEFTQTHSGAVLGTPFYMAPEQMRGLPVDRRVDVYALGVTLYELFSGERPFFANAYADLVLQVCAATPTRLEAHVPDLPPRLAPIVRRAMARDPNARFASVRELADALAPYAAGSRVITRSITLADTPLAGESAHRPASSLAARSRWSRAWLWLPLMAAAIAGVSVLARTRLHSGALPVAAMAPSALVTAPRKTLNGANLAPPAEPPTATLRSRQPDKAATIEIAPAVAPPDDGSAPPASNRPKRSRRGRSVTKPVLPPPTAAAVDQDAVDVEAAHRNESRRAAVDLDRSDF